jgi:hypothetical protein
MLFILCEDILDSLRKEIQISSFRDSDTKSRNVIPQEAKVKVTDHSSGHPNITVKRLMQSWQ